MFIGGGVEQPLLCPLLVGDRALCAAVDDEDNVVQNKEDRRRIQAGRG